MTRFVNNNWLVCAIYPVFALLIFSLYSCGGGGGDGGNGGDGSGDTFESITEIKTGITDSAGQTTFTDGTTGEEVIVNTVDSNTNVPLSDIYVLYYDNPNFEKFIVDDPSYQYFPFIQYYEHNSLHEITMDLLNAQNFLKKVFTETDADTIKDAVSIEFNNATCDYLDIGNVWYEKTITGDEFAASRALGRSISMIFVGPLVGNNSVYIISSTVESLDYTLENILAGVLIRSVNWDVYLIKDSYGDPVQTLYTRVFIPSQAPKITINEPVIENNSVTISWTGSDPTSYGEANYVPVMLDATVVCEGSSSQPDLTYNYRVVPNDWISTSDSSTTYFLDTGTYTFEVLAIDDVGNIGAASKEFSVNLPDCLTGTWISLENPDISMSLNQENNHITGSWINSTTDCNYSGTGTYDKANNTVILEFVTNKGPTQCCKKFIYNGQIYDCSNMVLDWTNECDFSGNRTF